nr:hypothetical protein GCM10020092_018650 [Actinoplanes digitatis]
MPSGEPLHLFVAVPGRGQQIVDLLGVVQDVVQHEGQARRVPQPQGVADPGAEHALGALQRRRGGGLLGLVTEHGVVHVRVAEVARDPGVGDRHHAEPGILDLAYQRCHQLADALRVPTRLGRI